MKTKIKIIIDVGMIILVLIQMAYHLIGDSLHGWGGMVLFILIILHNIVNRKWYSGLRKKNWSGSTVRSILTNEKYKGDALLQKVYTVDFLSPKKSQ